MIQLIRRNRASTIPCTIHKTGPRQMRKLLILSPMNKPHTRTRPVNHLPSKPLLPNNISVVVFFLIFQKIRLENVRLINRLRPGPVELWPPIVSRVCAWVDIVPVRVFFVVWVVALEGSGGGGSGWFGRPLGGRVVLVETHGIEGRCVFERWRVGFKKGWI